MREHVFRRQPRQVIPAEQHMKSKKVLATIIATAALLVSASAFAQAPAAGAGGAAPAAGGGGGDSKDGYGYEFSDDPLSAGGFGPNDATIRVRPGPVRTTLIRPRTSFVPEMLKSVENL
jgi:hypothetical protein